MLLNQNDEPVFHVEKQTLFGIESPEMQASLRARAADSTPSTAQPDPDAASFSQSSGVEDIFLNADCDMHALYNVSHDRIQPLKEGKLEGRGERREDSNGKKCLS